MLVLERILNNIYLRILQNFFFVISNYYFLRFSVFSYCQSANSNPSP